MCKKKIEIDKLPIPDIRSTRKSDGTIYHYDVTEYNPYVAHAKKVGSK